MTLKLMDSVMLLLCSKRRDKDLCGLCLCSVLKSITQQEIFKDQQVSVIHALLVCCHGKDSRKEDNR